MACLRMALAHRDGDAPTLYELLDRSLPYGTYVPRPDGTVFGIISSTTEPFCKSCDRSRLTADGLWYLCLYGRHGVDLRQLEYFAAVARHRNCTRAAEELYVTQPALSQQVRRLDRGHEVVPFPRDRRAVGDDRA